MKASFSVIHKDWVTFDIFCLKLDIYLIVTEARKTHIPKKPHPLNFHYVMCILIFYTFKPFKALVCVQVAVISHGTNKEFYWVICKGRCPLIPSFTMLLNNLKRIWKDVFKLCLILQITSPVRNLIRSIFICSYSPALLRPPSNNVSDLKQRQWRGGAGLRRGSGVGAGANLENL